MISDCYRKIANKRNNFSWWCRILVPSLYLHYRNLQIYLQSGMKLTKIIQVLEFEQSQWLKLNVDVNTKIRKKACDGLERYFLKLINVSVFGKTVENITNGVDVKLVTNAEDY